MGDKKEAPKAKPKKPAKRMLSPAALRRQRMDKAGESLLKHQGAFKPQADPDGLGFVLPPLPELWKMITPSQYEILLSRFGELKLQNIAVLTCKVHLRSDATPLDMASAVAVLHWALRVYEAGTLLKTDTEKVFLTFRNGEDA